MESESAWFWWLTVPGSAVSFFVSFARVLIKGTSGLVTTYTTGPHEVHKVCAIYAYVPRLGVAVCREQIKCGALVFFVRSR